MYYRLLTFGITVLSLTLLIEFASAARREDANFKRQSSKPRLPVVEWVGRVECEKPDSEKACKLLFYKKGEACPYELMGSAKLLSERLNTQGKLEIRLVAKHTPKFLFWGNILVEVRYEKLPH